MNSAKVYLQRIRALDIKIRQLEDERKNLQLMATGNSSPRLDPNKVQTSGGGDVMARYVEKYIDIERQIEDLHYKYTKERRKITDEIQALENRQHVELLYLRYVKHNRLEEIACIMRKTNGAPYSYDHISWLHGQALKAFQEKYNL